MHELRHNGLYKPCTGRSVYSCIQPLVRTSWPKNHPLFGVGRTTYATKLVLYAARITSSRPHHIIHYGTWGIKKSVFNEPKAVPEYCSSIPEAVCYKSRL